MVDAIPISLSTEDFSKPKTLEDGLQKTKTGFMARLKTLFSASVVDDALIEELEEILYTADIGSTAVQWLLDGVHKERKSFESGDDVKTFMKKEILAVLQSVEKPLLPPDGSPGVLLMVGVNGAGKTTTIGKLASLFRKKYDKKVLLAAGDTFRAAAVEQLEEWGRRAECEVIKEQEGTDPAAVAFNAVSKAKAQNADIVIVDTAGRLQNRVNLMEELKKVRRVIDKAHQGAPHEVLLVVDANNGQNAVRQAVEFHQMIGLTGIIVTKLDGTAKGGVVIGIARELGIPVRLIGIGEKIEDLRPFNAFDFTEALFN
ncbi:signal recognition particle-docking protein FtsY [bacterium]|nr:signal recognition particle-docking protein FtsY [bacterium]